MGKGYGFTDIPQTAAGINSAGQRIMKSTYGGGKKAAPRKGYGFVEEPSYAKGTKPRGKAPKLAKVGK